jgi:hypothetical protein
VLLSDQTKIEYQKGGHFVISAAVRMHFILILPASFPMTILHGFKRTLLDEIVGFPNNFVLFIALIPVD